MYAKNMNIKYLNIGTKSKSSNCKGYCCGTHFQGPFLGPLLIITLPFYCAGHKVCGPQLDQRGVSHVVSFSFHSRFHFAWISRFPVWDRRSGSVSPVHFHYKVWCFLQRSQSLSTLKPEKMSISSFSILLLQPIEIVKFEKINGTKMPPRTFFCWKSQKHLSFGVGVGTHQF